MTKYMPQFLFDMCAVSVAKWAVHSGKPVNDIAGIITHSYDSTYSDSSLTSDVCIAAARIRELMQSFFPGDEVAENYTQLQYCIKYFEPDGRKKKKRFLSGTLFVYERREILDKKEQALKDIASFLVLTLGGVIPLAPDEWTLDK